MAGKLAEVKKLEAVEAELKKEISALTVKLEYAQFRMAELLCPYRVGDRLTTNRGLGVHGLLVEQVTASETSRKGNRWKIHTLAYSKAGDLTKRTVGIEEYECLSGEFQITKEGDHE